MFFITPHAEIRNICVEFIFRADSVLGFVSIQVLLLHTRLVLPRVVSMTIVPLSSKMFNHAQNQGWTFVSQLTVLFHICSTC